MSFWGDPLKDYANNRYVFSDYVNKEHFSEEVRKRFTYHASDQMFEHYKNMKATIYVFSEEELKELLNSRKVERS